MGMISDFLLVDPTEISSRFPGWHQPEPGWMPSDEGSDADLNGLEVLEFKSITTVMLDVLVEALGADCTMDTPFVSPSAEQILTVLPTAVVRAMADLDGDALETWIDAVVEGWREDIATIRDESTRLSGLATCTRESWAPVLQSIAALAQRCPPPKVMAMFNCV